MRTGLSPDHDRIRVICYDKIEETGYYLVSSDEEEFVALSNIFVQRDNMDFYEEEFGIKDLSNAINAYLDNETSYDIGLHFKLMDLLLKHNSWEDERIWTVFPVVVKALMESQK